MAPISISHPERPPAVIGFSFAPQVLNARSNTRSARTSSPNEIFSLGMSCGPSPRRLPGLALLLRSGAATPFIKVPMLGMVPLLLFVSLDTGVPVQSRFVAEGAGDGVRVVGSFRTGGRWLPPCEMGALIEGALLFMRAGSICCDGGVPAGLFACEVCRDDNGGARLAGPERGDGRAEP